MVWNAPQPELRGRITGSAKYTLLITRFVTDDITASQFEIAYLEMFKNEAGVLPEDDYDALNNLFLDVDAYCGDPDLRDDEDLDDEELDDEELVASAKVTLEKLI